MISRLVISLCFLMASSVGAEPHPHQGVVTPFKGGDPNIKLNGNALSTLVSGKPYQTQIQSDTGGRGMVVQDVDAPVATVWDRILDFNKYPKMVPKTAESQIYRQESLKHGQKRIWVRMKVGFPMLKIQFFINHLYDPSLNSLTWTLDYSEKSDLNDSVGFWYVIPHPDDPVNRSRVYYSVEISVFAWMPQMVVDFLSKKALTDATAWVKKQSELEVAKLGPVATTTSPAEVAPKRKLFGWFRKEKKVEEELPVAAVQEVPADKPAAVVTKPIGAKRYALVSTVFALILYNLYLYLAQ